MLICYRAFRNPRAGAWNNLESGNLESGPGRELILKTSKPQNLPTINRVARFAHRMSTGHSPLPLVAEALA